MRPPSENVEQLSDSSRTKGTVAHALKPPAGSGANYEHYNPNMALISQRHLGTIQELN
jgi:hypothetical protein